MLAIKQKVVPVDATSLEHSHLVLLLDVGHLFLPVVIPCPLAAMLFPRLAGAVLLLLALRLAEMLVSKAGEKPSPTVRALSHPI
jgi:hypothetical protein